MAKKIVNKNGTKNADTIEITGNNLKIKAGKGNDKITLTKGKKSFCPTIKTFWKRFSLPWVGSMIA